MADYSASAASAAARYCSVPHGTAAATHSVIFPAVDVLLTAPRCGVTPPPPQKFGSLLPEIVRLSVAQISRMFVTYGSEMF